ncbi:MAG: hypothetical protein P4L16_05565 [Chlamydiales bacterium]|nr:hypothetical protein [Chlamydiales bacterium]
MSFDPMSVVNHYYSNIDNLYQSYLGDAVSKDEVGYTYFLMVQIREGRIPQASPEHFQAVSQAYTNAVHAQQQAAASASCSTSGYVAAVQQPSFLASAIGNVGVGSLAITPQPLQSSAPYQAPIISQPATLPPLAMQQPATSSTMGIANLASFGVGGASTSRLVISEPRVASRDKDLLKKRYDGLTKALPTLPLTYPTMHEGKVIMLPSSVESHFTHAYARYIEIVQRTHAQTREIVDAWARSIGDAMFLPIAVKSSIEKFAISDKNMLHLDVDEAPSLPDLFNLSIFERLEILFVSGSKGLQSLPNSILNLPNLRILVMHQCPNLKLSASMLLQLPKECVIYADEDISCHIQEPQLGEEILAQLQADCWYAYTEYNPQEHCHKARRSTSTKPPEDFSSTVFNRWRKSV